MHQLALQPIFDQDNLCIECGKEEIFIKKRGLGKKCYQKWRRENPPVFKSKKARQFTAYQNAIKKYGKDEALSQYRLLFGESFRPSFLKQG